jgi:hypothetical protein
MLRLILLVVVVLLVFLLRCDWYLGECNFDDDCDDGNPCTTETCEWAYPGPTTYEDF